MVVTIILLIIYFGAVWSTFGLEIFIIACLSSLFVCFLLIFLLKRLFIVRINKKMVKKIINKKHYQLEIAEKRLCRVKGGENN